MRAHPLAGESPSPSRARWQSRQLLSLIAIQVVVLLATVTYSLWPPVPASPVSSDRWLIAVVLALVLTTVLVAPKPPAWSLDVLVACTWLVIAGMSLTRATGQGQLALGLSILALAVYMVYFLPQIRAFVEIGLMVGIYGATLVVNSHIVGPFVLILAVVTLVVGAVIIGGLRETDRQYRLLIENSGEVIFHSGDGLVQWISPSVTQVLGWGPEELIGTSIHRLWHPDDRDAAVALRDDAYRGLEGMGVFRILNKAQDYTWIEITFRPYRMSGGGGAVGTMRDVSSRVAAEQALIASEQDYRLLAELESDRLAQLASLHESRSRLFQDISHELRTPIAVIQAPLRGLLRRETSQNLTSDQRLDLESAARAADSLQRLVDGLLDVARGRSGQLVILAEPIDLATLTRDAVAMFRSTADEASIDLTVSTVAFPPAVQMDRDLWLKVLLNLVSNALKFTKSGEVSVTLHYDGSRVELRVADTGVGMTEADMAGIFDRFQQGNNQATRGQSGSGLGLALVAELVRAIGGSIDVESIEGVGSTFTVRLPAEICDEVPTAMGALPPLLSAVEPWLTSSTTEANSAAAAEVSAVSLDQGRVLLVEDHEDLRCYIARLLLGAGWQVTAVADAESAQPLLPDHDLLLTDVLLPGMDGFELVRWLRNDEALRWTPVILLTAKAGRESVVEGLGVGADDFITKPFDPDELVARVGTHLELALLRRVVLDEADNRSANLQRALASNRVIGTALGILMARQHVTSAEAFTMLREHSQLTNRKLRDVADDVVFTGQLPATSHP